MKSKIQTNGDHLVQVIDNDSGEEYKQADEKKRLVPSN